MNRALLIGIPATILLCSGVAASANDATTGTGNELIKICNTENYKAQNVMWGVCAGYVLGAIEEFAAFSLQLAPTSSDGKLPADVNAYRENVSKALSTAICYPSNATREQYALVVSKYLMDHPEKLNWESANLVIEAVSIAWPCRK